MYSWGRTPIGRLPFLLWYMYILLLLYYRWWTVFRQRLWKFHWHVSQEAYRRPFLQFVTTTSHLFHAFYYKLLRRAVQGKLDYYYVTNNAPPSYSLLFSIPYLFLHTETTNLWETILPGRVLATCLQACTVCLTCVPRSAVQLPFCLPVCLLHHPLSLSIMWAWWYLHLYTLTSVFCISLAPTIVAALLLTCYSFSSLPVTLHAVYLQVVFSGGGNTF